MNHFDENISKFDRPTQSFTRSNFSFDVQPRVEILFLLSQWKSQMCVFLSLQWNSLPWFSCRQLPHTYRCKRYRKNWSARWASLIWSPRTGSYLFFCQPALQPPQFSIYFKSIWPSINLILTSPGRWTLLVSTPDGPLTLTADSLQ